jgi:MFS family permease
MTSATAVLSTDLYTPSLPHLQGVFGADAGRVQLTLTLNLIAYALAQLFWGPLSERIGRRPVLLLGMVGFAASTALCAIAGSIDALILGRVLQGLTACAEAVVGYAVIRKLYSAERHVNSDKLLAAGWDDAAAGAITITASQCLFAFGLGLIFATAPVRAFDVCGAGHGHAAAMLGALPMAGSALGTFCMVLLHDGSAWPDTTVLAGAMLIVAALYLYVRPWQVVQTAL